MEWRTSPVLQSNTNHAQTLIKYSICTPLSDTHLRSILWRCLLSRTITTVEALLKSYEKSREIYSFVKKARLNHNHPNEHADVAVDNPLSQYEDSLWHNYFRNKDLLATIRQDVVRTFPENAFFRDGSIQDSLVNILFCYSLENPQIGYKQGMHELLAPLLFVTHFDKEKLQSSHDHSVQHLCCVVSNPEYLEHDAYAIFCLLMEGVNCWFCGKEQMSKGQGGLNPKLFARPQDLAGTNELLKKLSELSDERLKSLDLDLYLHLERLEIAPQVYGIRWLRLLFGREFPFEDVLILWDAIFANTAFLCQDTEYLISFPFVDHVFLAMLLAVRNRLLTSDYTGCLQVLMRFPPMMDIQYIINMAKHLQNKTDSPKPIMPLYMTAHSPTSFKNEVVYLGQAVNPKLSLDTSKLKALLPSSETRKSLLLQNATFKTKRKSIALNVEIGEEPRPHSPATSITSERELGFLDKLQPFLTTQRKVTVSGTFRSSEQEVNAHSPKEAPSFSASSLQTCVNQMSGALRSLQNELLGMGIPLEHDTFVALAELKQVRDILRISLSSLGLPGADPSDSIDLKKNGHYLPVRHIDKDASLALEALEEAEEVTDRSEFAREVFLIPFSTGTHI